MSLLSKCSRDETLSGSELTAKLEPAFLSGLRCAQPLIRAKFFEVFDNSMKRRVYERLLYVTCSQNWEAMGNHFWIKQCIEVSRVSTPTQRGRRLHRRTAVLSSRKELTNSQEVERPGQAGLTAYGL